VKEREEERSDLFRGGYFKDFDAVLLVGAKIDAYYGYYNALFVSLLIAETSQTPTITKKSSSLKHTNPKK
jgi:hypothetical protein